MHGYFSFGGFTFENYVNAWARGDFAQTFTNTAIIVIPSVLITLLLASSVAFVLARFSFKFNLTLLALFTAANLLPQQALLVPLFRLFLNIEVPFWFSDSGTLYDTYYRGDRGQHRVPDRVLHVRAEQLHEDAAAASCTSRRRSTARACCASSGRSCCRCAGRRWPRWRRCRSPGSTTTSSGRSRSCAPAPSCPVTSSLQNLRGQFFTDYNLLSAGSVIVAIPTLVIFFVLQRHLRAGLTLGATKG